MNQNPETSSAVPDVKEEEWTIKDAGGVGVRDVWQGKEIVCIEVPPSIAKAFCDRHNASIRRVLEKKEAVAESVAEKALEEKEADVSAGNAPRQNELFFVFDVESIGLHGDAFAVAGGVYGANGAARWEFRYACPTQECDGADEDRAWVLANVPASEITHRAPKGIRDAFWGDWQRARADGAWMAADCSWPVEAKFLEACVKDDQSARNWEGPYPLIDIGSVLVGAGFDPMKDYERTPSELPKHDPLADARQSARLLALALNKRAVISVSDSGGSDASFKPNPPPSSSSANAHEKCPNCGWPGYDNENLRESAPSLIKEQPAVDQ